MIRPQTRGVAHGVRDALLQLGVAPEHIVIAGAPVADVPARQRLDAPVSAELETIAQRLLSVLRGGAGASVTVTGDAQDPAREYAAVELARALSAQGIPVVVVDMQFDHPGLGGVLPEPDAEGVVDMVRFGRSVRGVLQQLVPNGPSFIGAGSFPRREALPFEIDDMRGVLHRVALHSELALYVAPLASDAEMNPLVPLTEHVVVAARVDNDEAAMRAVESVREVRRYNLPLLGVVLYGAPAAEPAADIHPIPARDARPRARSFPAPGLDRPTLAPEPLIAPARILPVPGPDVQLHGNIEQPAAHRDAAHKGGARPAGREAEGAARDPIRQETRAGMGEPFRDPRRRDEEAQARQEKAQIHDEIVEIDAPQSARPDPLRALKIETSVAHRAADGAGAGGDEIAANEARRQRPEILRRPTVDADEFVEAGGRPPRAQLTARSPEEVTRPSSEVLGDTEFAFDDDSSYSRAPLYLLITLLVLIGGFLGWALWTKHGIQKDVGQSLSTESPLAAAQSEASTQEVPDPGATQPPPNVDSEPALSTGAPGTASGTKSADPAPAQQEVPVPVEAKPEQRSAPPPSTDADAGRSGGNYSVHVGSYQTLERAYRDIATLQGHGLEARAVRTDLGSKGIWYRIYVGSYTSRGEADAVRRTVLALPEYSFAQVKWVPHS